MSAAPTEPSPFRLHLLGDAGLKTPAMLVESLAEIEPGLVDALLAEMHRFKGLGMAAQQVGGRQRVCVVRLSRKPGISGPRHDVVLINPRILDHSPLTRVCPQEGCLSVPGFRTSTRRHPWVDVEYEDATFTTRREWLVDLDAQIVQHEIDHLLHGKCIADGVSRQLRKQAERCVAKARVTA